MPSENTPTMRLLLIDDDRGIHEYAKMVFSKAKQPVEIISALNLHDGINAITGNPHAVLLDLNLTDSDIDATIKAIPHLAKFAPIIPLTGYGGNEDETLWHHAVAGIGSDELCLWPRCVDAGAKAFFHKAKHFHADHLSFMLYVITNSIFLFHAKRTESLCCAEPV